MKIHNDGLQGSAPLETGRTHGTQGSTSNSNGTRTVTGHDGDSVAISGISSQVSDANAADQTKRAQRVAELEALYARGGYQVSADALSKSLVSNALGGTEGGGTQ